MALYGVAEVPARDLIALRGSRINFSRRRPNASLATGCDAFGIDKTATHAKDFLRVARGCIMPATRTRATAVFNSEGFEITKVNIRKMTLGLTAVLLLASVVAAQDKTTGNVKGKVRVESGSPAGVSVIVLRGDDEVSRAATNEKGEFEVRGLKPGTYGLTFRKVGLKVGKVEDVEVRAGKTRSLSSGLYMTLDEGSLAIIQGSTFRQSGRSLPGARVELSVVRADGTVKKLDSRVSSSELGRFVFKLTPEAARYRLTATAPKMEAATEEVAVDGAAIYRVALTLAPSPN